MNFRASFCDPFKPDVIDMGSIAKEKVFETFENIPWMEYLAKMNAANENDIYYSPSLEIENTENKNGISISILSESEWFIFYKRPKLVKRFFGLMQHMDNNYSTDKQGQTESDVRNCITALLNNDLQFLENKINS